MINRPIHLLFVLFLSLVLTILSYAVTAKDTTNSHSSNIDTINTEISNTNISRSSDNLISSNSTITKLSSQSMTLKEAKDLHYVGETFSGFIALLEQNIPNTRLSQIEDFVNQINQLRQAEYNQIAKKNVLDPDMIAKIAGEKLVTREPKNHYVKGLNGQWILIK